MRNIETTWREFGLYPIELGKQEENDVTAVLIDVSACLRKYPDAVFGINVVNAAGVSYPAEKMTLDNGVLSWVITSGDTAAPGSGTAQLVMFGEDGEIGRSEKATTVVKSSILPESTPPSVPPNWMDSINRLAGELDAKVDDAELGDVGNGLFVVQDVGGRADKTTAEIREAVANNMMCLLIDKNGILHTYHGEGELESISGDAVYSGLLFASTPYYSYDGKRIGFWAQRMVVTEEGQLFWSKELARTSNPARLLLHTSSGSMTAIYDGSEQIVAEIPDDFVKEETDPTVHAWAKEPQKPAYTAEEIGLGNVADERQYSAENPPPYPVTSVNGQVGDVVLPEELFIVRASGNHFTVDGHEYFIPTHADKTAQEIRDAVADGKTCLMVDDDGAVLPYLKEMECTFEGSAPWPSYPTFVRPSEIKDYYNDWVINYLHVKEDGSIIDLTYGGIRHPNPHPITFAGAVDATYDGSEAVTIPIPEGGAEVTAESITNALGYTPAQPSKYEQPDWGAEDGEPVEVYSGTLLKSESSTDGVNVSWEIAEIPIEAGRNYIVNWNGVEYQCVAGQLQEGEVIAPYLGSLSLLGGVDTGEPFVFITFGGGTAVATDEFPDDAESVDITIAQDSFVYHKIPSEYLEGDAVKPITLTVQFAEDGGTDGAVSDTPFETVWEMEPNDIARALRIVFPDGHYVHTASAQVTKGELIADVRTIQINARGLYDPSDYFYAPTGYTFIWFESYGNILAMGDATYMPYDIPKADSSTDVEHPYLRYTNGRWIRETAKTLRDDILPISEAPHQMLVTDADGAAKWEDKLCYSDTLQVEVLPETELVNVDGDFFLMTQPTNQPIAGVNHTVIYNGTAYECVAELIDAGGGLMAVMLGAIDVLNGENYTADMPPFILVFIPPDSQEAQDGVWGMLMSISGDTTVTVSVKMNDEHVKQIEEKYIPEMPEHYVVTVTKATDASGAYTANRTYEELLAAYDAGKMLYCYYDSAYGTANQREDYWLPLQFYTDATNTFVFATVAYGDNLPGGNGCYSGFAISKRNGCAALGDNQLNLSYLYVNRRVTINGDFVLTASDGTEYKLVVSTDGTLSTEKVE